MSFDFETIFTVNVSLPACSFQSATPSNQYVPRKVYYHISKVKSKIDNLDYNKYMETPRPNTNPDCSIKVTLELSDIDIEILRGLSKRTGQTMTESLRSALATENSMRRVFAEGSRVFIQPDRRSSNLREVVFIDSRSTPPPSRR